MFSVVCTLKLIYGWSIRQSIELDKNLVISILYCFLYCCTYGPTVQKTVCHLNT